MSVVSCVDFVLFRFALSLFSVVTFCVFCLFCFELLSCFNVLLRLSCYVLVCLLVLVWFVLFRVICLALMRLAVFCFAWSPASRCVLFSFVLCLFCFVSFRVCCFCCLFGFCFDVGLILFRFFVLLMFVLFCYWLLCLLLFCFVFTFRAVSLRLL